jgi:hypothetical protein
MRKYLHYKKLDAKVGMKRAYWLCLGYWPTPYSMSPPPAATPLAVAAVARTASYENIPHIPAHSFEIEARRKI